jgi:peptide/nickel transport system ATP-binding protein
MSAASQATGAPVGAELLAVRDLKLQFRSMRGVVKALDGVNLTVHEREILGLVGESGCGKTITGLAVLGLLQRPQAEITSGEIRYRGDDLLAKSDAEMRDLRGREISMVFQDPLASLNPVFQVGHQIEDVVRTHKGVSRKEAREVTRKALAEVGLPPGAETLKRYPHQFSGGMRQRVCMAMALACGSPLLIADEPTTALDVTIQAQILNLLLRLREELGVAQVIITHNVGVAAQTCDRIAVMYAGSVVEEGPVAAVLKWPRHPYTMALYQCLPHGRTAAELQTIPGTVPDLIAPPSGCRFHPRCSRVMDACPHTKPDPVKVGDRHWVSCFWAAEQVGKAGGEGVTS